MLIGIALANRRGDDLLSAVQVADDAGIDFVTIDDSFSDGEDRLDALLVAARLGPITHSIGLVPTVTVTHTEPFNLAKNIATLDWVSRGRAGWRVAVSTTADEARLFGRKPVAPPDVLGREAVDVVEVNRRLWDSWEDDAIIRDRASGRYIDRERVHYVDFEGEFFSVRGPSITPRSPQGQPLVMADADGTGVAGVVAHDADVVLVPGPEAAAAVRATATKDIRILARLDGPATDILALAHHDEVDGVLVRLEPDDVHRFVGDVRHLLPPVRHGIILRERFGFLRPANRYARSG